MKFFIYDRLRWLIGLFHCQGRSVERTPWTRLQSNRQLERRKYIISVMLERLIREEDLYGRLDKSAAFGWTVSNLAFLGGSQQAKQARKKQYLYGLPEVWTHKNLTTPSSPPSDQDRPRRRLRACSNRWLGKHCRALQTSFVTVSPQACALTQTVCLKSGVFLLLLLTLGIEITMKKALWNFIRENIILGSSLEKT